jgi:carbon-monoxide dehydrogenase iron sulfur subunit
MDRKVLVADPLKCTGCNECVAACSAKYTGLRDSEHSSIYILQGEGFYLPVVCQHCQNPSCMAVCPAKAIYRDDELNRVMINQDLCIGCKMCVSACPTGAMAFDEYRGRAYKCDLCGGNPVCVLACETKALDYVEASQLQYPRLREAAGRLYGMAQKRAA